MATILDLTPHAANAALGSWFEAMGEPAFRVRQVLPLLWQRPTRAWAFATELPSRLRPALDGTFPLPRLHLEAEQRSRDGTRKYLWRLGDGQAIESVWIPEGRRRTLCVSSQVGCPLGCAFCATGRMGFSRNLEPWEIAAQVRELAMLDAQLTPSNVVFMGMGEPLLNWPAVDTALTIMNDTAGLGIGARHITVSTVGILPALEAFARRPEQFRLAVSLHAPTAARRRALMPIEKRYPLSDLIRALGAFRRRVTLEYVLIAGANDADADADALAALAKPLDALVNLLPLHPGGIPGLVPATPERLRTFARHLRSAGAAAVVRRSRGLDIAAACGQLRVEIERREVGAQYDRDIEQQE